MPDHLKFIISTIAVLVAVAMFWLDTRAGAGGAAPPLAPTHPPVGGVMASPRRFIGRCWHDKARVNHR